MHRLDREATYHVYGVAPSNVSFFYHVMVLQEEFAHFFSTRKGIVQSYVVEDENGEFVNWAFLNRFFMSVKYCFVLI